MEIFQSYFNQSMQKIADNFLNKIQQGKLTVTFPDKTIKIYKGKKFGYDADISLKNYKLFSKLLRKGSVGFAESYMDNDFVSKNLSKLLLLANENENYLLKNKKPNGFIDYYIKFQHYLNENTKSRSKKNISYHYDLGNNFYKHWLDKSMTYSSAIFTESKNNLYDAQIYKYKQIANPLNLNENSNLLEIGCGWGGFSTYVAKEFGSNINAITISKEQFDFASERIYNEGLADKVKIQMKDYRDISERYTNIASIEMFEAVGKKYWTSFSNTLKNCLTSGGIASLQIITINDERVQQYEKNPDFIQQYIFPGGFLPSKKQLENINKHIGLSFYEVQSFKDSYAKTLNIWNQKFQKAWPMLANQGFSLQFKKKWEYYLSYCETGFVSGATDVSQFVIKK